MRTTQATDIPRRHNGGGASATSPRARGSDTPHRVSVPRQLERALEEVERLRRELARSEQRAAAAQRHAEGLLKATGKQNDGADRSACGTAGLPSSWSTWHTIDATLFERSDPASAPGERILWAKSRISKAHVLYRAGDRTEALYAVRFGSCKTELLSKNGQEQVVGFYMVGDVIGADGIASEVHTCQATALEDTEVFRLPLDSLEELARHDPAFGPDFHKLLSQETARAHTLMLVLGLMRAEQRLAFFLIDLSRRYQARGYSSCEYVLRMSRQEIGSYLGLKLETVSRLFTRFHREGVVQIDGRNIVLRDRAALIQRAEGA